MVFSFPNYLDHPNIHQFQQHQEHHQQSIGVENHQLQQLPPPPPPPLVAGGGGGPGSIRPGSMVDRARMAKIPLPEAGAKCPRCDSTNTKFCYYNNYNLSQPRHFCKGCRRYWTKGGALRNVPVGGGCRRNKRNKSSGSSSSKSTAGDERQMGTNSNSNSTNRGAGSPSINGGATNMAGLHFQQSPTQLPFMSSLHNYNQQYSVAEESGSQVHHGLADIRFNIGSNNLSVTGGSAEPPAWMLPSFQGGFDPPTNLFHFQREGVEDHHQIPSMAGTTTGSSSNNTSAVKMENHQNRNQELNISRQFLDSSGTPQENWAANAWTNGFSGLNSSSTSHLL